jgi:hypothetical protein
MTYVWPSSLPQNFEVSSYIEGVGDGLIEHQPDRGPPITRLGTAASPRPVSGTMVITATQLAAFKTFFNTTIAGGSLPFTFPPQVDAAVISPDITWLVKFTKGSLPHWTSIGGSYLRLTISLLILP